MGTTKIINVLKDDVFEEIFELVRTTDAREVIFVLPKKSKLFSKEEHFLALSADAKRTEKTLSILCANQKINEKAHTYDFNILSSQNKQTQKAETKQKAKLAVANPTLNDDVHDESQDAYTDDIVVPSDERVLTSKEPEAEEETKIEEDNEYEDVVADEEKDYDEFEHDTEEENKEGSSNASFATVPMKQNGYRTVAARASKKLDGVVGTSPEDERNIHISQKREKNLSVDILKKKSSQKTPDIESVWHNIGRRENKSVWSEIRAKKPRWPRFSFPSFFRRKQRLEGRDFSIKKKMLVISGGIAAFIIALILFYPASAKITITPRKEPLSTRIQVEISDAFTSVDAVFHKIPGQFFSIERTINRSFVTLGEREIVQKARGIITVYNEYGSTPQTLIATTRFQSPDGLVFRTLKTIYIPPVRVDDGNIIPGKIEVEVIADKPGSDYNIDAAEFRIVAFKERGYLKRYEKMYGRSTKKFAGGVNGMAKVVTEGNYNEALKEITQELENEINSVLTNQTKNLELPFIPNIEIADIVSSAKIDEAAEEFTITISGTVRTAGFKKDDLFKLVQQIIEEKNQRTVVEDKIVIEFQNPRLVAEKDTLIVDAIISGSMYAMIDENQIINELLNKTEEEIKDYFKNLASVATAKVVLSPQWSKRIPEDIEKIHVTLEY